MLENKFITKVIDLLNSMNEDDIQFGIKLCQNHLSKMELIYLRKKLNPVKLHDFDFNSKRWYRSINHPWKIYRALHKNQNPIYL